jgi:RNA polymerase sigma factor (sigma-70 family)
MERSELHDRLSRISTQWSLIFQAHEGTASAERAARQALMQRYCGAVYRYLLGITRDPDAADDLAQEFAIRFLRGDFQRADPGRGRFRDFLKAALRHLVVDHHRRKRAEPGRVAVDDVSPDALAEPPAEPDDGFLETWREELLARAWEGLVEVERRTGQPYHAVLRLRAEQPELRSAQMAERLSAVLGRPLTAVGVRQTLHRARDQFADLLLEEVARSLPRPTREALEEELVELKLLEYCRPALARSR